MDKQQAENLVSDFQSYQQQMQSLLIQKESFRLQTAEIDKAVEELNASNQKTAYKITGGIMVSKPVEDLKKELGETKEAIEIRMKSMEKTEERISLKLKELQTKLKDMVK